MKKIIMSLSIIAAVAAIVVGATTAFFSDTETSTGNTFTAGALDLKVDNECHYWQDGVDVGCGNWGNWTETDLKDGVQKFFLFSDIKPGDWGEDTISIHVHDNDAWGSWGITNATSSEGTCTEPETETQAQGNNPHPCVANTNPGQLGDNMTGMAWLDQGKIPGFQCNNPNDPQTAGPRCHSDPFEGDNIWQQESEPMIATNTNVDNERISSFFDIFTEIDLTKSLMGASTNPACANAAVDGHDGYAECHGLARDGRMVGSTTYYIGWKWTLPASVGNEVQTDMLGGNIWFKAEQHRNNPHNVGV